MVIDDIVARRIMSYVDTDTGLVDRRIFVDRDIYQLELE